MTRPTPITADYTLRPSALADALAGLVEARQPVIVQGPPGCAKSQIARQVAAASHRTCLDVRARLLDPVDLRGIPWRDADGRTRLGAPGVPAPGLLSHVRAGLAGALRRQPAMGEHHPGDMANPTGTGQAVSVFMCGDEHEPGATC